MSEHKEKSMQITIIGCGNMGSGLAERLHVASHLALYDHNHEKGLSLAQKGFGIAFVNAAEALRSSEMIILAVKPQNIKLLAEEIKDHVGKGKIIISLLAGTTYDTLKKYFPDAQVVRMMPNLPLIYGEGVIGLSTNEKINHERKASFEKILKPLGKILWLPEEKMNGLTALAGSGPAFFLAMVEAMVDSGIAMGFTAAESQSIVHQMLKGTLTLLEQTGKHPGEIKWQIASPQGTTISGLQVLEEKALRGSIINTFLAAYERANKLADTSVK